MEWGSLIRDYLSILLSWPPVVGVTVIVFTHRFKPNIAALIDRIKVLKFPGGELNTSQIARAQEELPSKGDKPEPQREPVSASGKQIASAPVESPEEVAAERARAALWEYRYLNYYLARGTQVILDWLASLPVRTTVTMFDSFWLPVISSPQERQAILGALNAHWLIVIADNQVIEVTEKGREYLQWRGPLPPAVSAAQ